MHIAWQRNDGLVGVSAEMPTGFGDCSFRKLGEFEAEAAAIYYALAAPGARRPVNSPLVLTPIAGVWTPWAEVLCRKCHDDPRDDLNANRKRQIPWPQNQKWPGDEPGFCTKCGAAVWVQDSVAQLTRLRAIAGGEMEQTGGMCAALILDRTDGGKVVVTMLDGPLVIGLYRQGEWEDGEPEQQAYNLPPGTPDEIAVAVIRTALAESLEGATT